MAAGSTPSGSLPVGPQSPTPEKYEGRSGVSTFLSTVSNHSLFLSIEFILNYIFY